MVSKEAAGWTQLALDDGARAEMRYVNVTQETYPLGLAMGYATDVRVGGGWRSLGFYFVKGLDAASLGRRGEGRDAIC